MILSKAKLAILFLLPVFSINVCAYHCINKATNERFDIGAQNIRIPIFSKIVKGENVFGNIGDYIDCKNDIPETYIDTLYVVPNGIKLGPKLLAQSMMGGGYINGSRYLMGNSSRIDIFSLTDGDYHPVKFDMFFQTPDPIGPSLHIAPGDILMVVDMHFSGWPPTESSERDYRWTFIAANEALLNTSNCIINNNKVIDVDFGYVSRSSITGNGLQTFHKIEKEVNVDCNDPNINQAVKISLSADYAHFSRTAFKTSMPGLGVELYHNGNVIPPFSSFNSYVINGSSHDIVTFALVKDLNASLRDLEEGAFVATASLIISQP
ncbi:TPA: fimbrial protein [Proteus mirabilis]|nr:fimbrial protein [Proteus mirabilis]